MYSINHFSESHPVNTVILNTFQAKNCWVNKTKPVHGDNKQGDNKHRDNKQGSNKHGENKHWDNKQGDNKQGDN